MLHYYKSHFVMFQSFKAVVAVIIIVCIVVPTKINRLPIVVKHRANGTNTVITETYNMSTNHIDYSFQQMFCRTPNPNLDTTQTVRKPLEQELDIPVGSKVGSELSDYAKCRYEVATLTVGVGRQHLDKCLCKFRVGYGLLFFVACVSVAVCLTQTLICLLGHPWRPEFGHILMAVGGACFWLVALSAACITHFEKAFEFIPPRELYEQSYFDTPWSWSSAVGFGLVYFVLTLLETAYICAVVSHLDDNQMRRRRRRRRRGVKEYDEQEEAPRLRECGQKQQQKESPIEGVEKSNSKKQRVEHSGATANKVKSKNMVDDQQQPSKSLSSGASFGSV